ncbi:MAG: hypothetical protein GF320_01975 [Armatimonadia bacterium]|nr:hypothetical protein [Armatimonadia bacterium]
MTLALVTVATAAAAETELTVTHTRDAGEGSYRAALEAANATGGNAVMRFDIPEDDPGFDPDAGTWTITLTDTPPSIVVPWVTIDGGSQTRAHGDTNPNGPEVVLSGGGHQVEFAVSIINAAHCTIRGLSIVEFLYGIQIYGPGATDSHIAGNHIGLGSDDARVRGNYNGVELISGAHGNTIGGAEPSDRNVISGNEHIGIRVSDAHENIIVGNYVGLDISATAAVPNSDGICIEGHARDNVVGGPTPAERNIVSGNVAYGVDLFGVGVSGNQVLGNYIGTDLTGTAAVPNTYGVLFDDRSHDNVVGGLGEGEGNLISGNTAFGAYFYNMGTRANRVVGNRIGTDVTGTRALPNETGVHIDGGTVDNAVDSNLISGNLVAGITLFALYTDDNHITRNLIGTDATGQSPLGNGVDGIRVAFGPRDNVIGGSPEDANVIAHNGRAGVVVESPGARGNTISANRIFGNGRMGIDLFPGGPNPNDPGDVDEGPNGGMNAPVILSVERQNGGWIVSGGLDTRDPAQATVEVYLNPADPGAPPQGSEYLGTVRPDADGRWSLLVTPDAEAPRFSATATGADGSTSEFGAGT